MGRATSKGNEAKSKMKHPSDILTPRRRAILLMSFPVHFLIQFQTHNVCQNNNINKILLYLYIWIAINQRVDYFNLCVCVYGCMCLCVCPGRIRDVLGSWSKQGRSLFAMRCTKGCKKNGNQIMVRCLLSSTK